MYSNAVILAAGKGVRLDLPDVPKPLVRIGHKPLLLWTIERLQEAGVERIWIVAGAHGDAYRKALLEHPSVRAEIRYVEGGTGSRDMLDSVLSLPDEVAGPFLLTVADILSEANPYRSLAGVAPVASGEVRTMVGFDPAFSERSGAHQRVRAADGRVAEVGRELASFDGVELGVYAVGGGPELFRGLIARHADIASFEQALNRLAADGRLSAEALPGEWYDINTPGTAVRAELFVRAAFYAAPAPSGAGVGSRSAPAADASFARAKHMETRIAVKRGLLQELDRMDLVAPERRSSPHFLLTDSVVDGFYGDLVLEKLRASGLQVVKLVMKAGEGEKNFQTYLDLMGQIFAHGMDEGSVIFNLGGGVVNNMAGFLAATIYRGVMLVHIPTSTMAQVDAAIDFKQAVNSDKGKNLIGAYHPASWILIDPDTLKTLPERHLRNGLAESLKHALAQDKPFFDWFRAYRGPIGDLAFWDEVIRRTVALKVPLLNAPSQTEINEMAPQYGHAVGHAVEHLSGYELLHGEAVAIGMCVCAEVARIVGACDDATVEDHYALCEQYGLPTRVPAEMSPEDVLETIRYDKHYLGKLPRMALPAAPGVLWSDRGTVTIPVDYAILSKAIRANQVRSAH